MKKTHYLTTMFAIGAIVIEALPSSAVLIFSDGISTYRETFSYFSLTPFGYANFGPLLTAVLTSVILVLSLVGLFRDKDFLKAIRVLSIAAIVTSLMPLMYGFSYFTVNAVMVTVMLAAVLLVTCKPGVFNGCSCC